MTTAPYGICMRVVLRALNPNPSIMSMPKFDIPPVYHFKFKLTHLLNVLTIGNARNNSQQEEQVCLDVQECFDDLVGLRL